MYIKAENEDLRKYIEKMDKPKIEVVDSDIAIKNIKFKQALEEIREILKPYLTDCQGWLCEAIDETLKKINEVLKDESN